MTTSIDSSAIMIEWDDLYGMMCWRCFKVTEAYKHKEYLRCTQCHSTMAKKLDPAYKEFLEEGATIQ